MRSPRLSRFLTYVVEKTLAGDSGQIKGYVIGVDVFDRGSDFDPGLESIVRVQAGKLRAMLDQYYETGGTNDPVRITIKAGSYVPKFSKRDVAGKSEQPKSGESGKIHQTAYFLPLAALVFIAIAFVWINKQVNTGKPQEPASPKMVSVDLLFEGPSIAVFPFTNVTGDELAGDLAKSLAISITNDLIQFKDLAVIATATTLADQPVETDPLGKGRALGVKTVLFGFVVETDDKVEATLHLLDTRSGRMIWADTFSGNKNDRDLIDIQTNISVQVAARLGQPYGVLNRLEMRNHVHSTDSEISAYGCTLEFFEYAQHETEVAHLRTRNCLEQAARLFPGDARVKAALSWMYADEHRHGYNPVSRERTPLELAIDFASEAVRLEPEDAFSHRRLADVMMVLGRLDEAIAHIDQAVLLNPHNAEILADLAWIIKNDGQWQRADEAAKDAIRLNPGHPPWYLETPFLYQYRAGNCEESTQLARQYNQNSAQGSALPVVFLLGANRLCGRPPPKPALTTSEDITDLGALLAKYSVPEELIPSLVADAKAGGLVFTAAN